MNTKLNLTEEEIRKEKIRLKNLYQTKIDPYEGFAIGKVYFDIISYDNKIKELEEQINKIKNDKALFFTRLDNIVDKLEQPLYNIWYYLDNDMGHNGGNKTILEEEQLKELLNNNFFNVNVVLLYDINEMCKNEKIVLPDWIDEKYKKQILNPNFNSWHNRLLENN
jgi:hypothetical protein